MGNTSTIVGAGRMKKHSLLSQGNIGGANIRVRSNDLAPSQITGKAINKEESGTKKRKRTHKRRKSPDIFDKKQRR